MTHDILYLGSQSKSRRSLLTEAQIPHVVLEHTSNEQLETMPKDFVDQVKAIAQQKMTMVRLPDVATVMTDYMFVLTADSLVRTATTKQILGKPKDLDDARRMLALLRVELIDVASGCCLEKKIKSKFGWQTAEQVTWVTQGSAEFIVEPECVEDYLKQVPDAMYSASAGILEGVGQNFFKSMIGSYTAVRGLPIFELRHELITMGFKF